jgi:hypothetical protein
MENLSKSINLQGTAPSPDRYGTTEEIMREDGSASINDSARKRSIHYHPFEHTIMGAFQEEETEERTYRKTHTDPLPSANQGQ